MNIINVTTFLSLGTCILNIIIVYLLILLDSKADVKQGLEAQLAPALKSSSGMWSVSVGATGPLAPWSPSCHSMVNRGLRPERAIQVRRSLLMLKALVEILRGHDDVAFYWVIHGSKHVRKY